MGTTDPHAHQLDAAQTRRLVGSLCLRPGEQVLHLGTPGAAAARLASYLVGPTGQVLDAHGVAGSGRLPFPDGTFDAVVASQVAGAGGVPPGVLSELGRVTRPTGRVAFVLLPSAGGDPERVAALVERSGLRGTSVRLDPGTDPDAVPAWLVTAFPPRPPRGGTVPVRPAAAAAGGPGSGRRAGPALTLLAGVGLAAGLLIASMVAAGGGPAGEPARAGVCDGATAEAWLPGAATAGAAEVVGATASWSGRSGRDERRLP